MGKNKFTALKNINLSFGKGEFAGLVGPSGSGKTTLLNIIGSLDVPSSGEAVVLGHSIGLLNAKEAARITELKERAQLIHFTLTTPWGAPFVGETTLLEAANTYSDDNPNSSLQHLLTDFSHYSDEKHTPLLNVYNEILEEL